MTHLKPFIRCNIFILFSHDFKLLPSLHFSRLKNCNFLVYLYMKAIILSVSSFNVFYILSSSFYLSWNPWLEPSLHNAFGCCLVLLSLELPPARPHSQWQTPCLANSNSSVISRDTVGPGSCQLLFDHPTTMSKALNQCCWEQSTKPQLVPLFSAISWPK